MPDEGSVRARFESLESLEVALAKLKDAGMQHYDAFGPVNLKSVEDLMPDKGSTVRAWTTAAALFGLFSFWFMCVASSLIYDLVVGGKPSWSNVPFVVVMYEGTILTGSIVAFIAGLLLARLRPRSLPSEYDTRFSGDSFGVAVQCKEEEEGQVVDLLKASGAAEIYEH